MTYNPYSPPAITPAMPMPYAPMDNQIIDVTPAAPMNPLRFTGYQQYGDERSFLEQRWTECLAQHRGRILATEVNLKLWASHEDVIFKGPKTRDDEERYRSSKPFRIVELYCGLVLSKEPRLQVAACKPSPFYTKQANDLEQDVMAMMNGWNVWGAWERAIFWTVVGGVGAIEYYYDAMAMDDEPLMATQEIDPRLCVWKEGKTKRGQVDYIFTVKDEHMGDLLSRYGEGAEAFQRWGIKEQAARMPMSNIKVYTYWAVERMRGPDGRPQRAIVNAVFTDYGWLKEPEIMMGYTKIPITLVRGSDFPLEHIDNASAYMSALEPVRDEMVHEMRLLSALLTNAHGHVNPATVVKSQRPDIANRVRTERGDKTHLFPDEEVLPMQKSSGKTPDVDSILMTMGEGIEGTTIPKQFQGNMELGDVSGISLSVASTGPLIRLAKRQQLVETAIQEFLPAYLACLARHAMTENRTIVVVGRTPSDQKGFHTTVLSPTEAMQLDGDVRIIAKLSASLPRDEINQVMTIAGLARDGIFSKQLAREYALRTLDMGHVNAQQEEQRIMYERLQQQQFEFQLGQGPGSAPSQVENDYVPAGYQKMGDGSIMADPTHQPGPHEPLMQGPMVERQPGPRMGPAVHDQLTGRGNEATSNPLLHRRRSAQSLDRMGAMMNLQPRR